MFFQSGTCRSLAVLRHLCLLAVCLGIGAVLSVLASPLPVYAQDLPPQAYLPHMSRADPPLQPLPSPARAAVFADTQWKTSSASVAVDAQGGTHMAFVYYEPANGQAPNGAVYVYCAGNCNILSNWSGISIDSPAREVQVALTPAGQPRLLVLADSAVYAGGWDYYYAACDQNCTDPNRWNFTYVLSSDGTATFDISMDDLPQRYFALDPQGRPRFLYLDRNYLIEPDHYGFYYVHCDSNCNQQASWSQTLISEVIQEQFRFDWEVFKYPSLAFTPSGQPRIVAEGFPLNGQGEPGFFYFECNGGCDNSLNWQHVSLFPRGQGPQPSSDIEVDAAGRPRIVYYEEATLDGTGSKLYYAWCDGTCLNPASWQNISLGLPDSDGQEPDIELDGQGRPRVAYAESDGDMGLAWCDSGCGSAANWQRRMVETMGELYSAWPVPYPSHCDASTWTGLTPSMALDRSGHPRFAYDATYHARCLYDDPNDNQPPYYRMELVMRTARGLVFPHP